GKRLELQPAADVSERRGPRLQPLHGFGSDADLGRRDVRDVSPQLQTPAPGYSDHLRPYHGRPGRLRRKLLRHGHRDHQLLAPPPTPGLSRTPQDPCMDAEGTFRHNRPAFMQLTTTEDGPVTILTVDGDLVIGESEATFKRTVTRLLEEGKVNLLVDMRKVGFLDSSGLGALVRAMTQSQKDGGQTKLLGAGPQVRKLLEMTKLDSLFENFSDMETAVSSF